MDYEQHSKKDKLATSSRFPFFLLILLLCFSVALFKLVEYQILNPNKYIKQAENLNITKQTIQAARGDIVDRNGKVLATNVLNLNLVVSDSFPYPSPQDKKEIAQKKNEEGNEILAKLINILEENQVEWDENFPITKKKPYEFIEDKKAEEMKLKSVLNQQPYATPEDVLNLLKEKYDINGYDEATATKIAAIRGNMLSDGFYYNKKFTIIEKIEPKLMNKITEMKSSLKGIEIFETATRTYPCGDVAAQIIGNVGPIYEGEVEEYKEKGYAPNDIVGKEGIEYSFEDHLRGIEGVLAIQKSKDQKTSKQYYEKMPRPGKRIELTIDSEFQKAIQDELTKFSAIHKSKGASTAKGSALAVLDVNTGEVLALVSLPTYDLNSKSENYGNLLKAKNNPLKNRVTCETYRPGSSFKPFMASAALLEGVISESTRYPCSKGNIFPRMGCMQDSHHGSHSIDIYTAISRSCNNYFYAVARDLGIEKINEYAPYFGFATKTGLEIKNEAGRVTNPANFEKRKQLYSVGQLYQTGIGQADTYVTVLQMATCAMTIANRGKRYETHLIRKIESYNQSEIIMQTQPKIASELDENSRTWDIVLKGMKMMAQTRGPLKGLDIATKSGSPQYKEYSKITNAAAIGFYPATSPKISFALIIEDGGEAPDFGKVIAEQYDKIFTKNQSKPQ